MYVSSIHHIQFQENTQIKSPKSDYFFPFVLHSIRSIVMCPFIWRNSDNNHNDEENDVKIIKFMVWISFTSNSIMLNVLGMSPEKPTEIKQIQKCMVPCIELAITMFNIKATENKEKKIFIPRCTISLVVKCCYFIFRWLRAYQHQAKEKNPEESYVLSACV